MSCFPQTSPPIPLSPAQPGAASCALGAGSARPGWGEGVWRRLHTPSPSPERETTMPPGDDARERGLGSEVCAEKAGRTSGQRHEAPAPMLPRPAARAALLLALVLGCRPGEP